MEDYLSIAAGEHEFLERVLSIFPTGCMSKPVMQGICIIFIGKLQASEKVYDSRASELSSQIGSLKALIAAEAGRNNTELSSLLMLLIQLRRLAHDHLLYVKAEVSEAVKQAEADLQGLRTHPIDSPSLAKLGDDILCKAPIAQCMARSAAFDAITAITSHVSHCVTLAFALHNFSTSIKERSLRLLAEDDQDSATLVLIERQGILNTIKTLVENCSMLTKVADWFAREAEKDILCTICANDIRAPYAERTPTDIEADCEQAKRIKFCCEIFAACLDPNSTVHDTERHKNWSFAGLASPMSTDSGYEALIKKVGELSADLRKKRASLSESMLSADVEASATLTSEIARQEEKVANLVSFGHELHAELYMLPHGLEKLTNRLSAGLLTLRSVLLNLRDEGCQVSNTEDYSGSFSKLAECYARMDTEKEPLKI